MVSAHGVSIAVLYACGVLAVASMSRLDVIQWPMLGMTLVPVVLVGVSLRLYDGPKLIHLLHAINLASLVLLAFLIQMVPAFP